MKTVERIYNISAAVLVGIIGGSAIMILVLYLAGIHPFIIRSGSMEPAISTGSLCFIDTNQKLTDMKEGDVVAFISPTGIKTAHRVERVTSVGLETKGDANAVSDGITTTRSNFVGKEIWSIPGLGLAVAFLQTLYGQVMAILVTAALFLVGVLIRLLRETQDGIIIQTVKIEPVAENEGPA